MAKKKKTKKVEPMFIVLYNTGEGKLHQVVLTYEQNVMIGTLLSKMHNGQVKVDSQLFCEAEVGKYEIEEE